MQQHLEKDCIIQNKFLNLHPLRQRDASPGHSKTIQNHLIYLILDGNKNQTATSWSQNYAFYPIVIADSRAPRDGRFIERIGSYNPNTNPATITLNFERALYWVNVGAQPTDTVRSILSNEGVLLMKHLQGGVKKGAFDEAEAQKRFDAWKAKKQQAVDNLKTTMASKKELAAKERLEAEKAKNAAKAEEVAKKKAEIAAAKAAEEAAAAPAEEAASEEATAEAAE